MDYDKSIQSGKYEIRIDSQQQYGYFEHDDFGEDDGGSFQMMNNEVVEIDACFSIPLEVAHGIMELGFKIDTDEFCI